MLRFLAAFTYHFAFKLPYMGSLLLYKRFCTSQTVKEVFFYQKYYDYLKKQISQDVLLETLCKL